MSRDAWSHDRRVVVSRYFAGSRNGAEGQRAMATLVLCVVLSLCFVATCSAAKLAMIPMFSGSHYHVMGKLGDELRGRGHEVRP